jgi:hypothetical protein
MQINRSKALTLVLLFILVLSAILISGCVNGQSGNNQSGKNQSESNQSVISQPVNNQSVISQPVNNQSVISQPVNNQSVISQPVNNQPVINQSRGINLDYDFLIHVVDNNGNIIYNCQSSIYVVAGFFNPGDNIFIHTAWFTSPGGNMNGTSGGSGWDYPFTPGEYLVLGESANSSLLLQDWNITRNNPEFNPGDAGYWKIYTYSDIVKNLTNPNNVLVNVTINLSNTTGVVVNTSEHIGETS